MPHGRLRQTVTSRALACAADRLTTLPSYQVWIIALAGMAAILLLNMAAGPNITLLPLYMLLAAFVSWSLGDRAGFAIAALCVVAGLVIRRLVASGAPVSVAPLGAEMINAIGRLFSIMFTVVLVHGLRGAFDMERWRGSIDPLTGALNRAEFEVQMRMRLREAARYRRAVTLAYIDLDGFKQINDTFHHAAGDDLLRTFAAGAMANLRAGDLFGRMGGDEFAALLAATDENEGICAAKEFHHRLLRVLGDRPRPVTCSTGAVIATPQVDMDGMQLLAAADHLMYSVKANGKAGLKLEVVGKS